jgi:hypothetical protein
MATWLLELAQKEGSELGSHLKSVSHMGVMVRIALHLPDEMYKFARDFYDKSENVSSDCLFICFFCIFGY